MKEFIYIARISLSCLGSPGVRHRFKLVQSTLSPSGKYINNDTLKYLPGEVLTDIRALADFSMCVTNINKHLWSRCRGERRSAEITLNHA